jgi:hypothetical protein
MIILAYALDGGFWIFGFPCPLLKGNKITDSDELIVLLPALEALTVS